MVTRRWACLAHSIRDLLWIPELRQLRGKVRCPEGEILVGRCPELGARATQLLGEGREQQI